MSNYNSDKEFVTSTITIEEYAIVPYRENNKKLLDDFDMLMKDTETDIVDITKPIAKKAAEIRANYNKFKAMDALQLAAAVISGCDVFLTNDKQLRQFKQLKVLTMDELYKVLESQYPLCKVNDIINFCFRFLQKPYTKAFARPKTKFLMSLTISRNFINMVFA